MILLYSRKSMKTAQRLKKQRISRWKATKMQVAMVSNVSYRWITRLKENTLSWLAEMNVIINIRIVRMLFSHKVCFRTHSRSRKCVMVAHVQCAYAIQCFFARPPFWRNMQIYTSLFLDRLPFLLIFIYQTLAYSFSLNSSIMKKHQEKFIFSWKYLELLNV